MAKRKMMTEAQAKAYIQGEAPFDADAWEREHCKILYKVIEDHIANGGAHNHKDNLLRTLNNYIKVNERYGYTLLPLVPLVEEA